MFISYQIPTFKFSTSAGNLDGFFRKILRNFEKIFFEFWLHIVDPFRLGESFNLSTSKSLTSIAPFATVKRRRCSRHFCSLIWICFNVPASKSSTLSLIAADVSTNLQSYRNAAWRAAKLKKKLFFFYLIILEFWNLLSFVTARLRTRSDLFPTKIIGV